MKIEADMRIIDDKTLFAVGDVILDELFVIHQVKVLKMDDKYDVFLPRKAGQNGWQNVIGIRDRSLLEDIKQKVKEAVMESAQLAYLPDDTVKAEVTLHKQGNIRGYAKLEIDGAVEINGIQIREKEGRLYTVYPYTMQGDNIQSLISLRSPFVREAMQQRILDAYREKAAESRIAEQRRMTT